MCIAPFFQKPMMYTKAISLQSVMLLSTQFISLKDQREDLGGGGGGLDYAVAVTCL